MYADDRRRLIPLFRLTNSNGRVATVHPNLALAVGTYKLHFDTGTYFTERNQSTFYPFVEASEGGDYLTLLTRARFRLFLTLMMPLNTIMCR